MIVLLFQLPIHSCGFKREYQHLLPLLNSASNPLCAWPWVGTHTFSSVPKLPSQRRITTPALYHLFMILPCTGDVADVVRLGMRPNVRVLLIKQTVNPTPYPTTNYSIELPLFSLNLSLAICYWIAWLCLPNYLIKFWKRCGPASLMCCSFPTLIPETSQIPWEYYRFIPIALTNISFGNLVSRLAWILGLPILTGSTGFPLKTDWSS